MKEKILEKGATSPNTNYRANHSTKFPVELFPETTFSQQLYARVNKHLNPKFPKSLYGRLHNKKNFPKDNRLNISHKIALDLDISHKLAL